MDMTFTFPGGARVDAQVGPDVIHTDQPPHATAPSPFTLFLASIGACAGVYVQAFCRRRGIPMDGIRIVQRNQTRADGMVEHVELDIQLPPDFPERYRDAVVRAADQCTVKQHLELPPLIVVRAISHSSETVGSL
jgi:ribosomal protein S12 methylthiotransferase accessory factor